MRRREAGYSLVALMATLTIMLLMMSAAVPTWRYLMKDDREEELIFRGGQIADAIQRYQKKNGNALPPALDMLVKGKYLRKLYKDPMTKDGKWRLVHQGEGVGQGVPRAGAPGRGPEGAASPSPREPGSVPGPSFGAGTGPSASPGTSTLGAPAGTTVGPILGVASTSKEKSLRVFNGRTRYDEWIFAAGQPRVVGRAPVIGASPKPGGFVPPAGTPPGAATPPADPRAGR